MDWYGRRFLANYNPYVQLSWHLLICFHCPILSMDVGSISYTAQVFGHCDPLQQPQLRSLYPDMALGFQYLQNQQNSCGADVLSLCLASTLSPGSLHQLQQSCDNIWTILLPGVAAAIEEGTTSSCVASIRQLLVDACEETVTVSYAYVPYKLGDFTAIDDLMRGVCVNNKGYVAPTARSCITLAYEPVLPCNVCGATELAPQHAKQFPPAATLPLTTEIMVRLVITLQKLSYSVCSCCIPQLCCLLYFQYGCMPGCVEGALPFAKHVCMVDIVIVVNATGTAAAPCQVVSMQMWT